MNLFRERAAAADGVPNFFAICSRADFEMEIICLFAFEFFTRKLLFMGLLIIALRARGHSQNFLHTFIYQEIVIFIAENQNFAVQ